MRQLLSTVLVACIVGALAGASFGVVAQAPAEPPVSTTALDADTVDGLSAVKATSQKTKRKHKLVATDAKGFLPSNIVKAKWGLIGGKPAFLADGMVGWNEVAGIPAGLADGQVGWEEVQGIPAGFADGADNEGVTGIKVTLEIGSAVTIASGFADNATATCPAGSAIVGGGFAQTSVTIRVTDSIPEVALNRWRVWGHHTGTPSTSPADLTPYAVCMSVEPSGAVTTAKKGIQPATVKKALKKRDR